MAPRPMVAVVPDDVVRRGRGRRRAVTTADIVGRITDTTGGVNNISRQMQFAAKLLF